MGGDSLLTIPNEQVGSGGLMLAGAASVGVSVPLQFLADKHLARAVWQHNARYAVEPR
jgi:hypothetical protein